MRPFHSFSPLALVLAASVLFLVWGPPAYCQPRDSDFINVATASYHPLRSEGKGLSDAGRIVELLEQNNIFCASDEYASSDIDVRRIDFVRAHQLIAEMMKKEGRMKIILKDPPRDLKR